MIILIAVLSPKVNTSPQVMTWDNASAGIAKAPAVCGHAARFVVSILVTDRRSACTAGTLSGGGFWPVNPVPEKRAPL